jgi:hypothetical protein
MLAGVRNSMSHSVRLNEKLDVIVVRFHGAPDFAEIKTLFDDAVTMPGFKPGLSLVADFRGSITPLTGAEIRQLANYISKTDADWGTTKWSVLASESSTFGLMRMFMALTDDHEVTTHVFRTLAEADDWLGLGIEMEDILAQTPE